MSRGRSNIPPIKSDWPYDVELWRNGHLAGWVHTSDPQDAARIALFWTSHDGGEAIVFANDRQESGGDGARCHSKD